jgi:hypothetical protein
MASKHDMFAAILLLLGVGLTQLQPSQPHYIGAGIGTIAVGAAWLVIRIIRDYKK